MIMPKLVQITIRINGGMHKSNQEVLVDFNEEERPSMRQIKKMCCKRFGVKEKSNICIIYNK